MEDLNRIIEIKDLKLLSLTFKDVSKKKRDIIFDAVVNSKWKDGINLILDHPIFGPHDAGDYYDYYEFILYTSIEYDNTEYLKRSVNLRQVVRYNLLEMAIGSGKIECTKYLLTQFPTDYKFDSNLMFDEYVSDGLIELDIRILKVLFRDGRF